MVRKITTLVFIAAATTALCLFLGAHWTLALSAGIVATSIKAYIIKRQQRNITQIVNQQVPANPQPARSQLGNEQEVKGAAEKPFKPILRKGQLVLSPAEIERRAFAIDEVHSGKTEGPRYTKRAAEEPKGPSWRKRRRANGGEQEKEPIFICISKELNLRQVPTYRTEGVVRQEIPLGVVEAPAVVIPQYNVEECLKLAGTFEFMRGPNGKVYVGLVLSAETPNTVIRNVGIDRVENLDFSFIQTPSLFQLYTFEALNRKIEETVTQVRELLAKKNKPARDASKEPSDPTGLIQKVCEEWSAIAVKFRALIPKDDEQLTDKLLKNLKFWMKDKKDKKPLLFQDLFDKCLETPVSYEILYQKVAETLTKVRTAVNEKRTSLMAQMKDQPPEKIDEALGADESLCDSWRWFCQQDFKDKDELRLKSQRTQEQIDELKDSLKKIKGLPGYEDLVQLFDDCLKTRFDLYKEALKQSVDQYHERDRVAVVVANHVHMAFQAMNAEGKANYRRLIDSVNQPLHSKDFGTILFCQTALYDLGQREAISREEQIVTAVALHDPKQDYRFKGLSLAKYVHTLSGREISVSTLGFQSRPDLMEAMNQFSQQLSGMHCEISLDQIRKGQTLDLMKQLNARSNVRVFRCTDAQVEVSEGWRFSNASHEGADPVFEQDRRVVKGLQLHDIANGNKRTFWFELEPSGQPDKPIQLEANVQGKALVVGLPVNRQFEKSVTLAEIPESNHTLQTCNQFLTYQQTISEMQAALKEASQFLTSAANAPAKRPGREQPLKATPEEAELIRAAIKKFEDVALNIEKAQLNISSIENLPLSSNLAHMEMLVHEKTKLLEKLIPAEKEEWAFFYKSELHQVYEALTTEINRAVIRSYQPADRSLSALKCAEVVQDIIEKGGAFFHGSAEMAEKFFMNPSDFQIVTPFTKLINTITACCWPDNAGKVSHIVAGYLKGGLFRKAAPGGEYLVYSYFSFDGAKPVFKHVLFQIDCAKKFILAEKAHDKCKKSVYDSFEEITLEVG